MTDIWKRMGLHFPKSHNNYLLMLWKNQKTELEKKNEGGKIISKYKYYNHVPRLLRRTYRDDHVLHWDGNKVVP